MGKTYLSGRELQQFPTIASLSSLCGEHDPEKWGLCQRDDEVAFGEADGGWVLQIPLNELYEKVHWIYGEKYNPDSVIVFYAIEVGTNNLEFALHELTPKDRVQMTPVIPVNEVVYN